MVSFGPNHSWCATFLLLLLLYMIVLRYQYVCDFCTTYVHPPPLTFPPIVSRTSTSSREVSRHMGALIEYSTLMYKSETYQMHLLLLCIVGKPTPLSLRKEAGKGDGCRVVGALAWGKDSYKLYSDILFVDILIFLRHRCTRNHE